MIAKDKKLERLIDKLKEFKTPQRQFSEANRIFRTEINRRNLRSLSKQPQQTYKTSPIKRTRISSQGSLNSLVDYNHH